MTATTGSAAPPSASRAAGRQAAVLVGAALAVAALSLLRPWALAFDPQAWVLWGRDTARLALDTGPGPSWKPLPVLFTTPFALTGGAAPALWLIVARAGGLLALAGTFALAARLAGRWAGVAGAATMALSEWWAFNTALGNSEGLLAAAVVWAIVSHLAGRPRAALALATAAALLRPEAWPFLGLYALWLWWSEPALRRWVVAACALIPLLWFGPDLIGAGGALGASRNARGIPSPGSAKLASDPVLALLGDAVTLLSLPAAVAAGLAAVLGGRTERVLAAGTVAWVAIVAAMTAAGYAGNPRYLVAAAAVGSALAGAGAVRLAASRGAPLGAAILVAAVLAATVGTLREQAREVSSRAEARRTFDGVLAAAGGRDALLRCGRILTSNRARSYVAWRLDLPMRGIDARPRPPGVVIRAKWFYGQGLEPAMDPRAGGYRVLAASPYWQIVASCAA